MSAEVVRAPPKCKCMQCHPNSDKYSTQKHTRVHSDTRRTRGRGPHGTSAVDAGINHHIVMAYTLPVKMARGRLAEVAVVFVFDIVCITRHADRVMHRTKKKMMKRCTVRNNPRRRHCGGERSVLTGFSASPVNHFGGNPAPLAPHIAPLGCPDMVVGV
jgi:hypothetical protein